MQIIFLDPLRSLGSCCYSENRFLRKPMLGDFAVVAYFITGHEQA